MKKTLITILAATVLTASLSAEDIWDTWDRQACMSIGSEKGNVLYGFNPVTNKTNIKNSLAQCQGGVRKQAMIRASAKSLTEWFGKFSRLESLLMRNKGIQTGLDWASFLNQYSDFLCSGKNKSDIDFVVLYSFLTYFPLNEVIQIAKEEKKAIKNDIYGKYESGASFMASMQSGKDFYDIVKSGNYLQNPIGGFNILKDLVFNKENYYTDNVKYDSEVRAFLGAVVARDYNKAWEIVFKSERANIGKNQILNRCDQLF
jgi:hypothetical protein